MASRDVDELIADYEKLREHHRIAVTRDQNWKARRNRRQIAAVARKLRSSGINYIDHERPGI